MQGEREAGRRYGLGSEAQELARLDAQAACYRRSSAHGDVFDADQEDQVSRGLEHRFDQTRPAFDERAREFLRECFSGLDARGGNPEAV